MLRSTLSRQYKAVIQATHGRELISKWTSLPQNGSYGADKYCSAALSITQTPLMQYAPPTRPPPPIPQIHFLLHHKPSQQDLGYQTRSKHSFLCTIVLSKRLAFGLSSPRSNTQNPTHEHVRCHPQCQTPWYVCQDDSIRGRSFHYAEQYRNYNTSDKKNASVPMMRT